LPIETLGDVGAVGALAAWRVTKGIYRFDPDVYQEIIDTPVTGDIPHEILFELPEWCVYIETPGMMAEQEQKVVGFFAHLEYGCDCCLMLVVRKDRCLFLILYISVPGLWTNLSTAWKPRRGRTLRKLTGAGLSPQNPTW
jgi:hypothetical protein